MKLLGLWLLLSYSAALASSPIISQDFEGGESGWVTMGAVAAVHTTHDPANVKSGKGALQFEYSLGKGISLALLPLGDVSFSNLKILRFWLKTESATAIAVVLSEKDPDGGRYSSIVWSPKQQWQRVELSPSDFMLSEGPSDPKDADGKLDLDHVQAVGLLDISQIFNAAKIGNSSPMWIDLHSGAQKLWVDDFEALDTAAGKSSAPTDGTLIDDFQHPQLAWLTLGGVDLSLDASGSPLKRHALKASYQQTEGRYVVIIRPLAQVDFRKANRLAFDIASESPAHLVISLEERTPGADQGPRYNVDIDVPGGNSDRRELDLAAFSLDENGPKDPDGKLDLDQIKSLSIVDITAAITQETAKNTFWISDIRAVTRP